ncbi:hypothetical protein ACX0G9_23005 [Flavitalea flava]
MKKFMLVCNLYKQLPLQMELSLENRTNLIRSSEDTIHLQATFFLQKDGSYIRFGETEQIAEDSLLLIVSDKVKQMILRPNHRSLENQLKQYSGIQINDSSLLKMAAGFTAVFLPVRKDTSVVRLRSRPLLTFTDRAKEEVTVKYNSAKNYPFEVTQVKRTLVPVTDSVYTILLDKPEFKKDLVKVSDSAYFIIREQISVFVYKEIRHDQGKKIPVSICDRLVADISNGYIPVKAYGEYRLTNHVK